MVPGPAPEYDDDSIASLQQDVKDDNVKLRIANALEKILGMVEETDGQLLHASIHSAQGGTRTVVYDAVEHVILDQIRKAVLVETINIHIDQYFEAGKPSKQFATACSAMTGSSPE